MRFPGLLGLKVHLCYVGASYAGVLLSSVSMGNKQGRDGEQEQIGHGLLVYAFVSETCLSMFCRCLTALQSC